MESSVSSIIEPIIDDILSKVFPPLPEMDEMLLTDSIQNNGVIDPLIIWKGTGILVDGHNRFRICKKLGIPYKTQEMEFEDINAAKTWMIKNQLGRRNLNAFLKVEMVLPLRESLLEEGRRRQGWRKGTDRLFQNSEKGQGPINSSKILAEMAGVSHDTFYNVQWLLKHASETTIIQLRAGTLTIHKAYKMTQWLLKNADVFTKHRIESGEVTLEEAYDEAKEVQRIDAEQGIDDGQTQVCGDDCGSDESSTNEASTNQPPLSLHQPSTRPMQSSPQQPGDTPQDSSDHKILQFRPRQQPNWCIDDYVSEPDDYVQPTVPYVRHDPDEIPLEERNINLGPLTGPHSTSTVEPYEFDIDPFDYPDYNDWEDAFGNKVDYFTYFIEDTFSRLAQIDLPPNAAKRIATILNECKDKINEKYEEVFGNEEE